MAECLKRLCYLTSKLVNSSTCLLISPTRIYIVLCAQNYKKTSKKFKCSKFRILKGRGKPKLNPKVELSVNLHKVLKLLDKYTTILRHTVLSYLSYLIFVCISKCADAQIHTLFITQIYTRFAEYLLGGKSMLTGL